LFWAPIPGLGSGPQALAEEPRIEEIAFVSHGATLSGSVVTPKPRKALAAVVFIHGSGRQTRNLTWARRFAAEGIAALVYDKRGVGRSGGAYEGERNTGEKNISLLADDAAAALKALARHPSLEGVPLGLTGVSQAGWIAPIAAQRSPLATFLLLWSGPVCKVSEEDIYSKYTADHDGSTVPSYRQALEARTEAYVWPGFLGRDTDSLVDLDRLEEKRRIPLQGPARNVPRHRSGESYSERNDVAGSTPSARRNGKAAATAATAASTKAAAA
jgi:dienelactone hydrolase